MSYHIVIQRNAQKEMQKLGEKDLARVIRAISGLSADPFVGKKLHGEFAGSYAIRVWPYRIIYEVDQKIVTVIVLRVGHRQGVYKK